jgi:hypothetical protein
MFTEIKKGQERLQNQPKLLYYDGSTKLVEPTTKFPEVQDDFVEK